MKPKTPSHKRCRVANKVKFSKDRAEAEALRYNGVAQTQELVAYHCKDCNWWHVGHEPKPDWTKN